MYAAFLGMIFLNALANILPLNGYTTGEVSNAYSVFFTPAGFTFSIWSVIYLSLLYWLVTFTFNRQQGTSSLFIVFLFTCLFNGSWIVVWHYLLDGVALLVILLHFISIYMLYRSQKTTSPEGKFTFPVSLYLGWIIVASLTNLQYWLVASVGINDSLHWTIAYTAVPLVLFIGIYFLKIERDNVVPLVFLWSLFGIAAKNYSDYLMFSIFVILILVLLALAWLGHLIKGKKTTYTGNTTN